MVRFYSIFNFYTKLRQIFFICLSFTFISPYILSNTSNNIVNLVDDIYNNFNPATDQIKFSSPSIAHISNKIILKDIKIRVKTDEFWNEISENINHHDTKILIQKIIQKESDLSKNKAVFYHAQNRTFLLPQDVYKKINLILFKKTIKTIVLLRIPNKESQKYKSVKDFLEKFNYEINDDDEVIKSLLLSVNPTIFGNTAYDETGESSLEYFLASCNANETNALLFTQNIFKYFNIEEIYFKYEKQLNELYEFLKSNEKNKTGILLQISIPLNEINQFIYQAEPWGKPCLNSLPITSLLTQYLSRSFINQNNSKKIDQLQFRVLLNDKFLQNKNIKIFRYFNKTSNIKIYKEKLNILFKNLEQDIKQDSIGAMLNYTKEKIAKVIKKILNLLKLEKNTTS